VRGDTCRLTHHVNFVIMGALRSSLHLSILSFAQIFIGLYHGRILGIFHTMFTFNGAFGSSLCLQTF
jgi:hypothetical protein